MQYLEMICLPLWLNIHCYQHECSGVDWLHHCDYWRPGWLRSNRSNMSLSAFDEAGRSAEFDWGQHADHFSTGSDKEACPWDHSFAACEIWHYSYHWRHLNYHLIDTVVVECSMSEYNSPTKNQNRNNRRHQNLLFFCHCGHFGRGIGGCSSGSL